MKYGIVLMTAAGDPPIATAPAPAAPAETAPARLTPPRRSMGIEEGPRTAQGFRQWAVTDAAGNTTIVQKTADKYAGDPKAVHAVLVKLGLVHGNPAQKSTK